MYYLDTGIWLDYFEDRNKPNLPKGEWAEKLVRKFTLEHSKIVYSDLIIQELKNVGYAKTEIDTLFRPLKHILIFVRATPRQWRKARDISAKRSIPKADAAHSIIARDSNATLVTLDRHFKDLDYVRVIHPNDLLP
jgi:predicted nucleic acid-binding protein